MLNIVQLCLAANNILLMCKRNHAFLLLAVALALKMADRFASRRYSIKNKLGDRMLKLLLNSVIAKYRDLSVSRRSIIDLLATDKSQYFAQPRPVIVNCWQIIYNCPWIYNIISYCTIIRWHQGCATSIFWHKGIFTVKRSDERTAIGAAPIGCGLHPLGTKQLLRRRLFSVPWYEK